IMQGCTDPSSTRQPCALAIKPHATTDPTGASATRTMRTRTMQYRIQGKRLRTGKGGGFMAVSSNLYPQMVEQRYNASMGRPMRLLKPVRVSVFESQVPTLLFPDPCCLRYF